VNPYQSPSKSRFDTLRFLLGLGAVLLSCEAVILTGGKVEAESHPALAVLTLLAAIGFGWAAVQRAALEARRGAVANLTVCIIVATLVTMVVYPVMQGARAASANSACISNTKLLSLSLLMYGGDHDERFPPANVWRTATPIHSELGMRCRLATAPWTYALNAELSALEMTTLENQEDLIAVFEANENQPNAAGGEERLAPRHSGSSYVGLADGRASRRNLKKFSWKPQLTSSQKP
jgi:hypothetical protein